MDTPILSTKLHIPSPRRNLVPRPRLLERLEQGLQRKLTLVSAPAGFGKTTLLGAWIQRLPAGGAPPVKVAWISLDHGDNDPVRFATYLSAALKQTDERIETADPQAVEWGGSFWQESQLVNLINQIAVLPLDFILLLDDYHLISSQTIHNVLSFLLDHLPQNLHLVIATRADPPLPLTRLRARGQLTELRQSDLRFSTKEAAAFLNSVMGLGLSAKDVASLESRTEGWIAGLQMASLSLQGYSPHPSARSAFIQAFRGSHRFILDYLVEEVLELQPAPLQAFLLQTSILDRLSGPLCDAVLDRKTTAPETPTGPVPDAQTILEHLEAANLFIVPLDHERCWYRYHRLFSDLLQKRLAQATPELVPQLHRRASAWHEQQGLVATAIDHALAAQDDERAANLIEKNVEAILMRSEVVTFLHWVERLPAARMHNRPTLCFFHAWALLMSGRSLDVVERRLQDMDCGQRPMENIEMDGRIAALRAYIMLFYGDVESAAKLGRQALEQLPESDHFLRSVLSWIQSLARLAEGNYQNGKRALHEIATTSQEMGNPLIAVVALCQYAKLQMRQGRLQQARKTLEQALQWATDPQKERLPIASEALIGLGELEREWNNLERAAEYLVESAELARQWSELAAFDAYFPLMRVRLAQEDVEAAREALETAQQIALASQITQVDDLLAELQQAHFFLAQGDIAGATRWAERRGLLPEPAPTTRPDLQEDHETFINEHLRKYEHLALARLFLLRGQTTQALDLLERLLDQVRQLGRIDLTIEIQILKALACQALGFETQALEAMAEALSLAEPGGYIRVFLDAGEGMIGLLRQAAARGLASAYVAKLLAAFGQKESAKAEQAPPSRQPLIEALSEREMDVLRLLAVGMSNPEIAERLVIAVSTVRSHCKSIYGKLDVHSRWDAVQRAQELTLL
ncbi:MAG: tetratricopeptide repeat protein [Chloroflexia bacterium]|nr:tetratricopeptide repeat protein [Chloroflexia bacterium]